MDELQRISAQADRLDEEYEYLDRMLDEGVTAETIGLIVSQAKTVRKQAGNLVRELAVLRDSYPA